MKIPQSIGDVRDNVAHADPDEHFTTRNASHCVVTAPLNRGERQFSYYFSPKMGVLAQRDAQTDELLSERHLLSPVCNLAKAFDEIDGDMMTTLSRDECLAFIDAYTKEHPGADNHRA